MELALPRPRHRDGDFGECVCSECFRRTADHSSEQEAQLPLKDSRLIALRGYRSESRVVDAVLRIVGLRMVHQIGGIEAKLNLLAFGNSELLVQAAIQCPTARANDCLLSKGSPFAGRWVLENNLARRVR